jgi:putative phosphoesterase
MRVLALSDIHNEYTTTEKILSCEKEYDIVLICGDITTYGSPIEAEGAIKQFQSYGKPVLAISGNMDSPEIDDVLKRIECSINAKGIVIDNVGFFGVSAAPISPLSTPFEISEDEILQIAEAGWKDVKNTRWKVFVPHSPPYDTKLDQIHTGKHVGSKSIRTFIDKRQPDIVICGHIHEARGIDILGTSQMINCGPAAKGNYAIIQIGDSILLENRG